MFPPGPNSSAGAAFIDLSIEHYGMHGTPDPGHIRQGESAGCIRVTNWDVDSLSRMVRRGTRVGQSRWLISVPAVPSFVYPLSFKPLANLGFGQQAVPKVLRNPLHVPPVEGRAHNIVGDIGIRPEGMDGEILGPMDRSEFSLCPHFGLATLPCVDRAIHQLSHFSIPQTEPDRQMIT